MSAQQWRQILGADGELLALERLEGEGAPEGRQRIRCHVCNEAWDCNLPMPVGQFVANIQAFEERHGAKGHPITEREG